MRSTIFSMEKDTYGVPTLTPAQDDSYKLIQEECVHLARLINDLVPEGRHRSLCLTRLEDLSLWAFKGISLTA